RALSTREACACGSFESDRRDDCVDDCWVDSVSRASRIASRREESARCDAPTRRFTFVLSHLFAAIEKMPNKSLEPTPRLGVLRSIFRRAKLTGNLRGVAHL